MSRKRNTTPSASVSPPAIKAANVARKAKSTGRKSPPRITFNQDGHHPVPPATPITATAKPENGEHAKSLAATMATPAGSLLLRIGKSITIEAPNMTAAQFLYCVARDKSGQGASEWPEGVVYVDGTQTARISYNGNAWDMSGALIAEGPNEKAVASPNAGVVEQLAPAESVDIPLTYLKAALAIAPKKDERYYMNGVFLQQASDTELRIVASDGHRMLVVSMPTAKALPWGKAGIILPREQLDRVVKYAGGGDGLTLSIGYGAGHPAASIVESGGQARFSVTPIDGRFPDYMKIVTSAGDVFSTTREPTETASVDSSYLKSAGMVAALLESKSIFPFVGTDGKPSVFTFGDAPNALLYISGMNAGVPALAIETLRLIGSAGMTGTLAALKAHETRTRNAAKAALSKKDTDELTKKADGYAARAAEIRAAFTVRIEGPKPAAAPEDATAEAK